MSMAIADENNGIMWDDPMANQLADNNSAWDYPTFEDENTNTEAPTETPSPVSDVPQEDNPMQEPTAEPLPTDGTDAIQQWMWPMKITEEALAEMKEQEKAEQEALAASQTMDFQLSEDPIVNDDSYNYDNSNEDTSSETEDLMNEWNSLWSYSFWEERVKVKRYNTWFVLSVLGLIVFWWLAYVVYLFYQYLEYKSMPVVPVDKEKTVAMVSDKYDEYGQKLWLFNLDTYKVIYLENESNKVDDLLHDSTLNFNQKKDDLQRSLYRMGNEITRIKKETKVLREKMNKEWFFPPELVWILEADNAISSIQRSLISLEVVKFSSALRVFSLMDDIVKELSDTFDITKWTIREQLEELINRWEQDVEYYLNVCYNNPYETEECININDFDKYYKTIKQEEDFDTTFFKKLMKYINTQIEYNEMPSFSITFNSFNGKSNSITFSVEVNTTVEDELALSQQGIKSPHIFIISELIKLLKLSTFIGGKQIDAKNVKVVPKIITIAWRQFKVNNSVNTYTLPIQKTTEREIFDFIETYSLDLEDTEFDMSGFVMSGFDMSGFMMSGFDMSGFMMSGFDMSGFMMSGFDMSWAVMTWAVMTWEIMTWEIIPWDDQYTWDIISDTDLEITYSWEVSEEAWFIADAQI